MRHMALVYVIAVSSTLPYLMALISGDSRIILVPDAVNIHIPNAESVRDYLAGKGVPEKFTSENNFEKLYLTSIIDGVALYFTDNIMTAVFTTRLFGRIIISRLLFSILRRFGLSSCGAISVVCIFNLHPESLMYLGQMYKEFIVWIGILAMIFGLSSNNLWVRRVTTMFSLIILAWERFYLAIIASFAIGAIGVARSRGVVRWSVVGLSLVFCSLILKYYFGDVSIVLIFNIISELRSSLEGNAASPVTPSMGLLVDVIRAALTPFPSIEKISEYIGIDYLLIFAILPNTVIYVLAFKAFRRSNITDPILFTILFALITVLFMSLIMPWAGRIKSCILLPLFVFIFARLAASNKRYLRGPVGAIE